MLKKCKKTSILLVMLCLCAFSLFACNSNETIDYSKIEPPDMSVKSGKLNLNFIEMHNLVIDNLTEQYTPFFFVKEGEFDISGDNDEKFIKVTCTCMDGTTLMDVDLFFSLVLNYISVNASEQDFRFRAPRKDDTNTYIDFGNVFDTYSLDLYAKTESGDILRDDHISAGFKNPIDPRYWSE